jgi:hypothetical protein
MSKPRNDADTLLLLMSVRARAVGSSLLDLDFAADGALQPPAVPAQGPSR